MKLEPPIATSTEPAANEHYISFSLPQLPSITNFLHTTLVGLAALGTQARAEEIIAHRDPPASHLQVSEQALKEAVIRLKDGDLHVALELLDADYYAVRQVALGTIQDGLPNYSEGERRIVVEAIMNGRLQLRRDLETAYAVLPQSVLLSDIRELVAEVESLPPSLDRFEFKDWQIRALSEACVAPLLARAEKILESDEAARFDENVSLFSKAELIWDLKRKFAGTNSVAGFSANWTDLDCLEQGIEAFAAMRGRLAVHATPTYGLPADTGVNCLLRRYAESIYQNDPTRAPIYRAYLATLADFAERTNGSVSIHSRADELRAMADQHIGLVTNPKALEETCKRIGVTSLSLPNDYYQRLSSESYSEYEAGQGLVMSLCLAAQLSQTDDAAINSPANAEFLRLFREGFNNGNGTIALRAMTYLVANVQTLHGQALDLGGFSPGLNERSIKTIISGTPSEFDRTSRLYKAACGFSAAGLTIDDPLFPLEAFRALFNSDLLQKNDNSTLELDKIELYGSLTGQIANTGITCSSPQGRDFIGSAALVVKLNDRRAYNRVLTIIDELKKEKRGLTDATRQETDEIILTALDRLMEQTLFPRSDFGVLMPIGTPLFILPIEEPLP